MLIKSEINGASVFRFLILAAIASVIIMTHGYSQNRASAVKFKEIQLTDSPSGHTLHNTQVFSRDDHWIVFDTRNDDSKIGETGQIEMVNTKTKEVRILYSTTHQTRYGPGVGAATFSPEQDTVLFIHGIRNADKNCPYSFTRRSGVAIDIHRPGVPIFMDGRDIKSPFTSGALRGGTHAHSWSGDGRWISFTYNDYVMDQLSKKNSSFQDLRTVGVMYPKPVQVFNSEDSSEDFSGEMFTVVVARVVDKPEPGSDEIEKAYDETWIGKNGYLDEKGKRHKRAIAFQGDVRDDSDKIKTEVFILDLPADITIAQPDQPLEGTSTTRPNVPAGVVQRRVTCTEHGIEGSRFWLRTTSDGSRIFFLAKDYDGIVQIHAISPNGGKIEQMTKNKFPVSGSFNVSPDDRYIAYMADNSVFITGLKDRQTFRLTQRFIDEDKPVGAPVWSNEGDKIAYNRYVRYNGKEFLQIFLLIEFD